MSIMSTNILDICAPSYQDLLHYLDEGSSCCRVIPLQPKSQRNAAANNTTEFLWLDARSMPDQESLVSRHGLTVGEASLTVKLAAGKSLDEAAEELLISDRAARTRLQRIIMKSEGQNRPPFIMKLSLTRL